MAHEMELHDLQTTPSLHQIFMNYVQGVAFNPTPEPQLLSWKGIVKVNKMIKVTQSALARLKHHLQRELT